MQTAQNPRSKHGAHISISDNEHHVTDAISSLYDYEGQAIPGQTARPLSYLPSAREEIQLARPLGRSPNSTQPINPSPFNPSPETKSTLDRKQSGSASYRQPNGAPTGKRPPGASAGGDPVSPVGGSSPTLPSPASAAEAPFPINNIDYESSPAAVAQELSNLQALRRMSMNVDATGDPDLPSFAAAPPGKSEDDPSRLFWVPARLHPELAPKEFKTFLDSRVESIKRRSEDFSVPNDDGPGRSNSGGLRRTRSRLSRQIDNTNGTGADGYHDGAELLDRKKSGSSRLSQSTTPVSDLRELESLMEDPAGMIQRLSLEGTQGESGGDEDKPIMPNMGGTLKRSTRTTYRKGSLRRGERVTGSRRHRTSEQSSEEIPPTPPLSMDSPPGFGGIQRSATDPTAKMTSNFSRPQRDRGSSPPNSVGNTPSTSFEAVFSEPGRTSIEPPQSHLESTSPTNEQEYRDQRYGSQDQTVPQVVESPPSPENTRLSPVSQRLAQEQQMNARRDSEQQHYGEQSVQPFGNYHTPAQGSYAETNDLTYIPTLAEDKRTPSKKSVSKKRSNDGSSSTASSGGKKSMWSSFGSMLSSEGRDKDKDRKKKKEEREAAAFAAANMDDDDDVYVRERNRRAKGRNANDTRLDLLQQQIEGGATATSPRGRESLVLDRDSVRLDEARSNERNKKTGKEKDGLLASIFGKKSRADRDSDRDSDFHTSSKKSGKSGRSSLRPQSPEVHQHVVLTPDIDYNWTRFSILEERAIYRMAHIKLANPRRELRSQVLLSNFMYSYLAKVQQMHPQLQIPQSAAQRKQQERQQAAERERQRKESGTPEEYYQYQRYQEQLQAQDAAAAAGHEGAYVEDQGYEYDDGNNGGYHLDHQQQDQQQQYLHDQQGGGLGLDPYSQHGDGNNYDYGQQHHHYSAHEQSPYQYQQNQFDDPGRRDDDDDMW